MLEILLFQDLPDIGLGIYQVNGRLLEAMAFLAANVASILTVRAAVRRLKIILGIPMAE